MSFEFVTKGKEKRSIIIYVCTIDLNGVENNRCLCWEEDRKYWATVHYKGLNFEPSKVHYKGFNFEPSKVHDETLLVRRAAETISQGPLP